MHIMGRKRIYLDYAATTPVRKETLKAMSPYWNEIFGNPSSLHEEGEMARQVVEEARGNIAGAIRALPEEIIFTSGGTEGNNLCVFGAVGARENPHIITTTIEHKSVLRSVQTLERNGFSVTYIKPDGEGFIKPEQILKAIRPETVLISVAYANNEIGTIEPIREIGLAIRAFRHVKDMEYKPFPLFHVDACQAPGQLALFPDSLHTDLMTFSAQKFYGPKGIGFIYKKRGISLYPMLYGGGQEGGLRPGTENVPLIGGMEKAFLLAEKERESESKRLSGLRDYFIERVLTISGAALNGPRTSRLPNNINISVPILGELALIELDMAGVSVSTGSACSTGESDFSYVILSCSGSEEKAKNSIRISLGKGTTKKDLDYVLKILPEIISRHLSTNKAN